MNDPATAPVKVLIVDDSMLMRQLLAEMLGDDPGIEVVGTAADAYTAREAIKRLAPDVITLDIAMPGMDGLTFLRNLMRLRPMPVVMVSTLTAQGAPAGLEALALGAVDMMSKPQPLGVRDFGAYAAALRAKIRAAARAHVQLADAALRCAPLPAGGARADRKLIAIGASAGGTEAIRAVLAAMPADAPPTVIVQHIPAGFSAAFAERLDRNSAMQVVHLESDRALQPGHAYVAPGGRHLRVARSGGQWWGRLGDDPPQRRHRPSVDVLFESVARSAGAQAAAALLTGMGDDGARGLLALRGAGALTLAQDEASSLIWGMPGAAVALGAACEVLPLSQIAQRLLGGAVGR